MDPEKHVPVWDKVLDSDLGAQPGVKITIVKN